MKDKDKQPLVPCGNTEIENEKRDDGKTHDHDEIYRIGPKSEPYMNKYQSLSETKTESEYEMRTPFTEEGVARATDKTPRTNSWIVALASAYLVFLMYSMWSPFGVYLIEFQRQFPDYRRYCAWLLALLNVMFGFSGIISGVFIEKIGTRSAAMIGSGLTSLGFVLGTVTNNFFVLAFSYGILCGIGTNFYYMAATIATQQHFSDRRALASGFIMTGGSVAKFITAPLVAYVISCCGWRAAFLMQAAFTLHGIPVGMLLGRHEVPASNSHSPSKQLPEDQTSTANKDDNKGGTYSLRSLLISPMFLMFLTGSFCVIFAQETPVLFNVSVAVQYGIPLQMASFILSSWAIASVPARFISGWLGDKLNRTFICAVCSLVAGISIIAIIYCRNLPTQLINGSFYGFFLGGFMTLLSPTFVDALGPENIPASQGFYVLLFGVSGAAGPVVSNLLVEATKSYSLTFIVNGVLAIVGGSLLMVCAVLHFLKSRRHQDS